MGEASNETFQFSTSLPTALPATILDAITVTNRLGFRYLWVDRYCINQHDKNKAQIQINQMDLIYQKASLTLVAASSKDPPYGLPGVGHRGRRRQLWADMGEHLLIDPMTQTSNHICQDSL